VRSALGSGALAFFLAFAALLAAPGAVFAASTINVNTTADENGAGTGCSLREAIASANTNTNVGGCTGSGGGVPFTINVPAGTYNLTVDELILGDATNTNTSIVGAGAASTIIRQTVANRRVFDINPPVSSVVAPNVSVSMSGVTISGGNSPSDNFGGAGIFAGGPGNALTLSNCAVSGNSLPAGVFNVGAGVGYSGGGVLTVNNCQFSNNTAVNLGGAISYSLLNNPGAAGQGGISVTNSTFTNNSSAASASAAGGAIRLTVTTTQTPSAFTISNNTFTGNSAPNGFGGAIVDTGSRDATIRFNRFANNTASQGSGIYKSLGSLGTINATHNWWGCNAGPGNTGCDSIGGLTTSINTAPRLVMSHVPGAGTLLQGNATTLTASFLTDSAGAAVPLANLSRIIGAPIAFSNATRGTLSSAATTVQTNGTATATFTAGTTAADCGAGGATAVFDNQSLPVSITIQCAADLTATLANNVSGSTLAGQSWIWTATIRNTGNGAASFTSGQTVFSANLPNSASISYGTPTSSNAGVTCSINGTKDLICTANTALSLASAASFTVSFSATANATGSYAVPRASGICAVDPNSLIAESSEANNSCSNSVTVNKANTTTTITGDTPDPSVVGQPVTVSYSVTGSGGTPTGNVTMSDGTASCTGTVAAGSCSITFTTAGAKTLTATYAGDTNFNGSTSAGVAHQVNQAGTTTTITADTPDPSTQGQAVTVNFTVVASAPGAGTPTGNVTVSDGVDSCSGTVAAGSCSITLSTTGNRTLTATYAGDTNFSGSASAGAAHTVNPPAKTDTTTTITSDNPDPSVVGQSVTINFTVTASSGTPTGNVTVTDGTQSCSGTVAAGSCTITFSSPGAKTLTATYTGDANFNGSTSAGAAHTVNKADTTTTITSDTPDPSSVGQPVTVKFTVAAKAPGAGTPTGNVVVTDGVDSCTASVAAGQCDITFSTSGSRTITASYGGDSNFLGSSDTNPHIVNLPLVLNLAVLKTHTGNFSQGQSGAQYTIKVSNPGTAGTNDTVTVVDSLPAGLTATAISGSGWTCALSTLTCTRSDALAAGSSYPDITLTVNVANNAPASVTNSATVSISGDSNASDNTSNDPTTIDTDNTPPDTTITSMPSNPSNSSSASFSFSGSDSGTGVASFECSLDGSSFTACTSAQSYSGLADGQHTFKVRAIDGAGNADQTPDSYTWVVDTTAPSVTINQAGGQADPTSASPIHFTVVFDEPVSGFTGADVTLSGTAGATSATVTEIAPNDGTTYDVAVSGMTTSGTVIATIPAGVAQDAAGNGNNANTSTDNSVMYIMPVVLTPDLTITKTHSGNFTQGQSGAQYTITVANVGNGASSGTVTAVDTLPAGLTATAISGSGWSCDVSTLTCTRSDALAAGSSYPDITLTVNVASNAPASVTNSAAVSGGGETNTGNDTASDPTTITTAAKINTTTTITADTPDPSTAGQAVTVSYTVVPASGSGTPTGNVSVTDGVNSCTGTVAAGQCSITLTMAGARTLTATYAGDSSYHGSTSAGAPHTVNPASTTPTCNGLAATIYVLNGKIVGGPDNGKTYKGSLKGTTGNDVIVGTEGKDSIDAKNGDDTVCGLGGDDKLTGDNGTDYLDGGTGKDELKGSSGNDTLVGGEGNDKLDGDEGNDTLIGGEGDDKLDGDKGNDTLTGNAGKDTFKGGDGTDTATDYNPAEGDKLDGKLP
jgi:CSLREA domain-containing protein/uncharacterized repeat protein (TIGR01451 family)